MTHDHDRDDPFDDREEARDEDDEDWEELAGGDGAGAEDEDPVWEPAMRWLERDTGKSRAELEAEVEEARRRFETDEPEEDEDEIYEKGHWRDAVRDGLAVYWRHVDARYSRRPRKQKVTLRLDDDLLNWLRAHGEGYQPLVNAALRAFMMACKKADV